MQLLRQLQDSLIKAPHLVPEKENIKQHERAAELHTIKDSIKNSIDSIQEEPSQQ